MDCLQFHHQLLGEIVITLCHLLETFGTLLNSVVPNIYLLPNASLNLLFLIYTLHTSLKFLSLVLIFIPNEKLYFQKF